MAKTDQNQRFSMKNAHADITELANFSTESNDDFGVERILEELLKIRT